VSQVLAQQRLDLKQAQFEFAAHIRNPDIHKAPDGIEDRRMAIYRELFYNNIEGFICSGFPVLRSICSDAYWHALVRDFMTRHRAKTPYFLEIAQEFLVYIQNLRPPQQFPDDPPYLLELAHYEWVELALDVSESEIPAACGVFPDCSVLMSSCVHVSPLVWCLSYVYPVHRIGPEYINKGLSEIEPPSDSTHLVVYRDRMDKVGFIAANAVTLRLLQLLQASPDIPFASQINSLAAELQSPVSDEFVAFSYDLLKKFYRLHIVSHFSR